MSRCTVSRYITMHPSCLVAAWEDSDAASAIFSARKTCSAGVRRPRAWRSRMARIVDSRSAAARRRTMRDGAGCVALAVAAAKGGAAFAGAACAGGYRKGACLAGAPTFESVLRLGIRPAAVIAGHQPASDSFSWTLQACCAGARCAGQKSELHRGHWISP